MIHAVFGGVGEAVYRKTSLFFKVHDDGSENRFEFLNLVIGKCEA